jgi:hypothetical protein
MSKKVVKDYIEVVGKKYVTKSCFTNVGLSFEQFVHFVVWYNLASKQVTYYGGVGHYEYKAYKAWRKKEGV